MNRLSVLSFENDDNRRSHKRYYLTFIELKDYNVVIDRWNLFDEPVKII